MEFVFLRNRHRIGLFGALLLFFLFLFIFSSEATFYEIHGKVLWHGASLKAVSAYLLNATSQINSPDKATSQQASQGNFSEEYAALQKESNESSRLSDTKLAKEARKKIKRNLSSLIKKYRVSTISLNKKGEFYLNVSPGITYHVFVLRKEGFLRKGDNLNFWLENVYFNPGEVLNLKELTFSESNVISW